MNSLKLKFKYNNIFIIYSFDESNSFNKLKIFFKKFFNYNHINDFFFNPDIYFINFKVKNNIFKKAEFFKKIYQKPILLKYKLFIINLTDYLNKNLYLEIIKLINLQINYLKFIIIINNDSLLNLKINSVNIFFKNKKNSLKVKVIKNMFYFLEKSSFLIKKWIKNKNYKIYYWFCKNILKKNVNIINLLKFLKIKTLINLLDKWLYDILMVHLNLKPKFFKFFYKMLKEKVNKINIKKLFNFFEKINQLKKKNFNKINKSIFIKKIFLKYNQLFNN